MHPTDCEGLQGPEPILTPLFIGNLSDTGLDLKPAVVAVGCFHFGPNCLHTTNFSFSLGKIAPGQPSRVIEPDSFMLEDGSWQQLQDKPSE